MLKYFLVALLVFTCNLAHAQHRLLHGIEPERLSSSLLKFHPGSVIKHDGTEIAEFDAFYVLDTSSTGPGGMDYVQFSSGVDYFPYVIKNTVTGEIAITLSDAIYYGGLILGNDWEYFRKLPWGFVAINGSYLPLGTPGVPEIPAFHISGWPKPFTRFTQSTTDGYTSKILINGQSSSFTSTVCTKHIPDNARLGYFLFHVIGSGSAYIRATGAQGNGIQLLPGQIIMHHRVTSDREIIWRTTGSAKLEIYVLGYSNTEPS